MVDCRRVQSQRSGLLCLATAACLVGVLACDDPEPTPPSDCTQGASCAELDGDGDGILDGSDNCPQVANADQINTDGRDDGGDACDGDDDEDGIPDAEDNCPLTPNSDQANSDGLDDGGDACDEPESSEHFLDYIQADLIPGRFPSSPCDAIDNHKTVRIALAAIGCGRSKTTEPVGRTR